MNFVIFLIFLSRFFFFYLLEGQVVGEYFLTFEIIEFQLNACKQVVFSFELKICFL